MKNKSIVKNFVPIKRLIVSLIALAVSCLALSVAPANGQTRMSLSKGKGFASPQEAVESLIAGAETYDEKQLMEILGPTSWEFARVLAFI